MFTLRLLLLPLRYNPSPLPLFYKVYPIVPSGFPFVVNPLKLLDLFVARPIFLVVDVSGVQTEQRPSLPSVHTASNHSGINSEHSKWYT